jgi:hypothetical protein
MSLFKSQPPSKYDIHHSALQQTPKKQQTFVREIASIGVGFAIYGYVEDFSNKEAGYTVPSSSMNALIGESTRTLEACKLRVHQQQQVLQMLIQNHSPSNSNLDAIISQYKVCQALQADLFIARWSLYHHLVARSFNPSSHKVSSLQKHSTLLQEIINSCEAERTQFVLSSMLQYLHSHCSASATTGTMLPKFATVTNLFGTLCVNQDQVLCSQVLDVFSKHCKINVAAWSRFIVASIHQHLGPRAIKGAYQSLVFDSLQKITKVCMMHAFHGPTFISYFKFSVSNCRQW